MSGQLAPDRDHRTGPPFRGPEPPEGRGIGPLPIVAGIVLAAVAGFLIWFLLVRDDTRETVPPAASGDVVVDAERVDFGDENVGGVSVSQRVTLTNGSSAPVRVEDVTIDGEDPGDFELVDMACLNARLDPGDACSVSVRFRPADTGGRAARLVLSLDGGPGERTVALAGVGAGRPVLVVVPTRLDFGGVDLDAEPEQRQVVVVNAGNLALHVLRATIDGPAAGDFRLGRRARCLGGQELAPGGSCILNVSFAPSEAGARGATLTLAHDAGDDPVRIQLRGEGTGRPRAALSPAAVDFGRFALGDASQPRSVTLRNAGTADLVLEWIALAGPNDEDFDLPGGTCRKGETVEPGASCTVAVRFQPGASGRRTATLVVASTDPAGFAEVALSGVGESPPGEEPPGTTEPPEDASTSATGATQQAEGEPAEGALGPETP